MTNIWFFLRFILPFYVFVDPLMGTIVSVFMDGPDGYFSFKAGRSWQWYHKWDKLADYWWYILIMVYALLHQLPIVNYLAILFILRSIGQFITLKKKESWMLIFFPNILENYWIAFVLFGSNILLPSYFYPVWIICIVIAVVREYLIHIKKAYAANYIFRLGIDWSKN